ncbi:hypothetical protein NIES3974_21850 [Calothrix sp. NIES-3974]|nr:hypothetical protein NIES3974_21850 [Calothrix sp. NIES-3974]
MIVFGVAEFGYELRLFTFCIETKIVSSVDPHYARLRRDVASLRLYTTSNFQFIFVFSNAIILGMGMK